LKKFLRISALVLALLVSGVWLGTGAHRGWTKTSVRTIEIEPVTGLENPVVKKQFVMGVELLSAGLIVAAALAGASFFFQPKSNQKT
jgi:hypothetical protein